MSSFFRGQNHQKQKQQQQQQGPSINGVFALRSIVPPFDQLHHLPEKLPDATNTNDINDDAILSNVNDVDDIGNHPEMNASVSGELRKFHDMVASEMGKKRLLSSTSSSAIVTQQNKITNTKKGTTGIELFSSRQQEPSDLRKNNNITTEATGTGTATVSGTSIKRKCGEDSPGNFDSNSSNNNDTISMSNKRIRVVMADDVIISSLPYVVPPQKENEAPMMIKKIHIVVDGTTMYSSLPFVVNSMSVPQRREEDQLNNNIYNSNDTNNNYDNVTHQDFTPSSTMLKSRLRTRATKKRKTNYNNNISTKFDDDDSDKGNKMSNNNNDGNQNNFKRKRSSQEQLLWNNMLLELTDYEREFKHTNVPNRYAKNKPLGFWVSTQRTEYKHIEEGKPSPLTKERIDSLNKLGFVWKITFTWDERLQQLVDFNNEFNHTNVPQHYAKNKSLGKWAKNQRWYYKLIEEGKPNYLTKERIESLNKLGFVWQLYKKTHKATAPVVSSTAMSQLSSLGDDADNPSNKTCTSGNNELCVVSTASASASASASLEEGEEKKLSVATIGCTSIAVAEEEEEDGYESNESELYLII